MVDAARLRARAPSPEADQREASDPRASVWVAASAGTGKTKVLTDRALRLMLGEGELAPAPPQRLLCLTFTKAAAAEMANRLNLRLGQWAIASDADLADDLEKLTGAAPDDDTKARARRLLARVLDTPGGMRIQTIHAFCQALLARFPLEAGIPPHFEVIDERTARELMAEVQEQVAASVHGGGDALARALAVIARHVHELSFPDLLQELARARGRIERLLRQHRGRDGLIAALAGKLGLGGARTHGAVTAAACAEDAFDRAALANAARALANGSNADQQRATAIAAWLEAGDADARVRELANYQRVFLTKDGAVKVTLYTKPVANAHPEAAGVLDAEAARIAEAAERARRAGVLETTAALITLGSALLDAYGARKLAHGWLDYDDLVLAARDLLAAEGRAAWVLYKLDGGLDHILIDEAQDTNPDQWAVVQALAEEFFAGQGARELSRTVFAVGDVKQSIYSFQGADPRAFAAMRDHFAARVTAAELDWRRVGLEVSFRSTEAVLDAVDHVFANADARDGLDIGGDGAIRHVSQRAGHAGLVELWPPLTPEPTDPAEAWKPPVERRPADSPRARLAGLVAAKIAALCAGERLEARGRAIEPGDIMVLVRRRNTFMDELIRRLKESGIPVAGIDRLVLTDHIAIMDLVALGKFLLLPDDDLSLAELLKSPLCGLDDDDLFDLAYNREGSLWQRLRARGGEVAAMLEGLLAKVDLASPFELYSGLLGAGGGRARILARLGAEASDPLDEFLAQALVFERDHVPSLQGFLHWLERGRIEVKRDLDVGRGDSVRVMTVHGAKGLQAPVVFLPDTLQVPSHRARLAWSPEGDAALWPPPGRQRDSLSQAWLDAAAARELEEYRRLLYVAMTRAADRLYVCGWETRQGRPGGCWYELIRAGLAGLRPAEPAPAPAPEPATPGAAGGRIGEEVDDAALGLRVLRLSTPQTAPAEPDEARAPPPEVAELPDWARTPPPAEPAPPAPLRPSAAAEEPPARSPRAPEDRAAAQRGRLIHRLLQWLPELAPDARAGACRRFLARPSLALAADAQEQIARSVLAVLEQPAFAPAFAPGSRAEVAIAGALPGAPGRVLAGQVDRIAVTDESVLVVDYKTGHAPPEAPDEAPPAYLRQMASYRAGLRAVYPDRAVRCALLWTEGPALMTLDDALLDAHAP